MPRFFADDVFQLSAYKHGSVRPKMLRKLFSFLCALGKY